MKDDWRLSDSRSDPASMIAGALWPAVWPLATRGDGARGLPIDRMRPDVERWMAESTYSFPLAEANGVHYLLIPVTEAAGCRLVKD